MGEKSLTIEQVLGLLEATPSQIAALNAELDPTQLRALTSPEEWSANGVLAHLRACADMWGGNIMTIVTEDRPTIRAINPRTWIKKTDYPELEFHASLSAFTTQRADLMAVLKPLPREGWSRSAIVKGAGKPLDQTVLYFAHRMAVHERLHIDQIARMLDDDARLAKKRGLSLTRC